MGVRHLVRSAAAVLVAAVVLTLGLSARDGLRPELVDAHSGPVAAAVDVADVVPQVARGSLHEAARRGIGSEPAERPFVLRLEPEVRTVTLPRPEPLPLDPYEPTSPVTIATMRIPAIGLERPVGQGMSLVSIDRGPSHWPGTALPGQIGNVVIAGHRTTFGAPFLHLDRLVPGDTVEFDVDGHAFVYAVTGTEIVTEDALHIADQTPAHTATLFACHPPGSYTYRIVVRLSLLGPNGRPVDENPLVTYEVRDDNDRASVPQVGTVPG